MIGLHNLITAGNFRMSCTIVSNNISSEEKRKAVSDAVREGIGDRLGEWSVIVYQALDYPGIAVSIDGPNELRWSWTFLRRSKPQSLSAGK